jgi:hypothetical protein
VCTPLRSTKLAESEKHKQQRTSADTSGRTQFVLCGVDVCLAYSWMSKLALKKCRRLAQRLKDCSRKEMLVKSDS